MKLPIFENAYAIPEKSEEKRVTWLDDLSGGNPYETAVENLISEGKIERSKLVLPLPYLSVSQVEQYLRCGKQYEFRYIRGVKSPPGIALIQGSTLHKALELGYRYMKKNKIVPPIELALDEYSGEFKKNMTSDVILSEDETEITIRAQGEAFLREWHKSKAPLIKPVSVESKFVTVFGGVPVVGAIDMIDRIDVPLAEDQRWENKQDDSTNPMLDIVVDNKFVAKKYSQADADNSLQMSLYSHSTGIGRQRYDMYVKSKIPKLETMLTSRNAKEVAWAAKVFKSVAENISKGIFQECSPSAWHCSAKWCGYFYSCRGKDE